MAALRVCTLALLFTAVAGLQFREPENKMSLRDWLEKPECLNMALVPQYNNQHSIWGIVEFLRKESLLQHLTGISACSGGTLPGAFIAAGKKYSDFDEVFPKNGWNGFGPSEPKISDDYTKFLSAGLPKTFEELKIPLALSATHWNSEKSLKVFIKAESHEVVLHTGELYPAMMTAVATGNNGVIKDDACPKCSFGFWPKQVGEMYPVTDGAFTDIWGTGGLIALPKCDRLLHVLPLDYPGQTKPQKPEEIPTYPKDLVTIVVTQTPIASHSYFQEGFNKAAENKPLLKPFMLTHKSTQEWNELMYSNAQTMLEKVFEEPMAVETISEKAKHYTVLVDNGRILRKHESFKEKAYDAWMSTLRDNFWKFWGAQDGKGSEEETSSSSEGGVNFQKKDANWWPFKFQKQASELGDPIELSEKHA